MSATLSTPKTTSGGEIIRELVNASDGQGLHFDGAGYVDCGDSTVLDGATIISVEAIIQPETKQAGFTAGSVTILGKSKAADCFTLSIDSDYKALFKVGTATATSSALTVGNVYHVVGTYDGATLSIYVNGNLDGTATLASYTLPNTTDHISMGRGRAAGGLMGSYGFVGTVYRARLFNYVIDPTRFYENSTVPFANQYGSAASKLLNGTAWTGATGATPPTSWSVGTTGTMTIDSSSGSGAEPALKIAKDASNPYIYQTFTSVIGKKYRVKYRVKNIDATNVQVGIGSSGLGVQYNYTDHTSTSWADFDETYTATSTTFSIYVKVTTSTGTQAGYIDSFTVDQIGCVADYDLAFANPTQSDQVQDRSTNLLDGTASAGVTQVTKIEAVNTNKLNVGGTTPRVGIGLAAGTAAGHPLHVKSAGTGNAVFVEASDGSQLAGIYQESDGRGALNVRDAGGVAQINLDSGGDSYFKGGNVEVQNDTASLRVQSNTTPTKGAALSYDHAGSFGQLLVDEQGVNQLAMKYYALSHTFGRNDGMQYVTISSAGTTTITPTGNVKSLDLASAPTTSDPALRVQADALTAGKIADFTSASGDTTARSLVRIINDNAAATGTTCFEARNDSTGKAIYANGGGIVEKDGVLKENLLTNSGFDVWSNSTLVDASTGAAPIQSGANAALTGNTLTNGGFDSDTTGWAIHAQGTGASVAGGQTGNCLEITRVSASSQYFYQAVVPTYTLGKLYEVSIYVKSGTSGDEAFQVWVGGAPSIINGTTTSSWVKHSVVIECDSYMVTYGIYAGKNTATAGTMLFDTFCVNEVTPGCVAANSLAFDGWGKSSYSDIKLYRKQPPDSKSGSVYSLQTITTAAARQVLWPLDSLQANEEHYVKYRGRTVTVGAWVKTSTANACRLGMTDGSWTYTDYHTDTGNWEWLELTKEISGSATRFQIDILGSPTATAATVDISQPMLVFGSAIGAGNYSRPMGEWIDLETEVTSNAISAQIPGYSDVSVTTLNLEADSNGKIPKNAKAVRMQVDGRDSASAGTDCYVRFRASSTSGYAYYCSPYGAANDTYQRVQGTQACDSSGDFQYSIEASGSGTFDSYVAYNAVQLR